MKRVKNLPVYKEGWTSQYKFKLPDGKIVDVYQSARSYGIGKKQRMFVNINGVWYELDEREKLNVF